MKSLFLTLSLLIIAPAFSQEEEVKKHPIQIEMEKAITKNYSTAGMVEAFSVARKKWDEELNKNYGILIAKLDPEAREALRESQRAWVAHRDKEIDYLQEFYRKMKGTMYRTIYAETTMSMVQRRAVALGHMVGMLEQRAGE